VSNQLEGELVIVKVGGSLYDYLELRPRLQRYLASIKPANVAIFPGGGPWADAVRLLDQVHGLGEEASHWLAVQSLSVGAQFLKQLLGNVAGVVTKLSDCQKLWRDRKTAVIDPEAFARDDSRREDALPRSWQVTSDSLALQLARRWHFSRLILLKSTAAPPGWPAKGGGEFVDLWFERLYAATGERVKISVVNLRED
jgi:aspartokinase-like uncharacterized kinase